MQGYPRAVRCRFGFPSGTGRASATLSVVIGFPPLGASGVLSTRGSVVVGLRVKHLAEPHPESPRNLRRRVEAGDHFAPLDFPDVAGMRPGPAGQVRTRPEERD